MNVIKQCRYGLMCYNTNDLWVGKSLSEYGEFSEGEAELFRAILKPGDTVFDVGANIGCHTVALARFVGPTGLVLAFEPQRIAYYMLCANVALNNFTNVYCLQNAVSSEAGRINVPELDYRKTNNFGGLELDTENSATSNTSVRMIKLDDYAGMSVKFIKIDVEGMERHVLLGAANLIKTHQPLLYVENDRQERASLLIQTLRRYGYRLYFHLPLLFNPNNYNGKNENAFNNVVSTNMLCVHKDQPCPVDAEQFMLQELTEGKKRVVIMAPKKTQEKVLEDMQGNTVQSLVNIAEMQSEIFYNADGAMKALDLAIQMNPDDWRLYLQAAPILTRHLRTQEALGYIDKALQKGGTNADTLMGRAVILGNLGRHEEAAEMYKVAIQLQRDNVELHFGLAIELLRMGQYEEGWKLYESRFGRKLTALSQFLSSLPKEVPAWDGHSSLEGKEILVFVEQGVGDLIQFIRFLPMVKALGARVILACFPDVAKLMMNVEGVDEIIQYTEDLYLPEGHKYDCMVSILSLPYVFGITLDNLPNKECYLSPVRDKNFDLSKHKKYLKVGIAWAGSETHPNDFTRSCHLKYFKALNKVPDARLFSLQKGGMDRNWPNVGNVNLLEGADVDMIDLMDKVENFNDTANLIEQLDLVISVDTSIVHLAAALGKPTWVLATPSSMGSGDWRWLIDREDSPWYPTVKVFRGADWPSIFNSVAEALDEKADYYTNQRRVRQGS